MLPSPRLKHCEPSAFWQFSFIQSPDTQAQMHTRACTHKDVDACTCTHVCEVCVYGYARTYVCACLYLLSYFKASIMHRSTPPRTIFIYIFSLLGFLLTKPKPHHPTQPILDSTPRPVRVLLPRFTPGAQNNMILPSLKFQGARWEGNGLVRP